MSEEEVECLYRVKKDGCNYPAGNGKCVHVHQGDCDRFVRKFPACVRCHKEIRSGEIMLRRLDEVQFASIHDDCLHGKLPGSLGCGIAGSWDRALFQRGSISNSPTARFMGCYRVGQDQVKAKPGEPSESSLKIVDDLAKTIESSAAKPKKDVVKDH
jgi:hypothetical protein